MTLELLNFNIWAALVGVLVQMMVAALWYSPLMFGNIWIQLVGIEPEKISKEAAQKSMGLSIIPAVVQVFLLAFLVSATGAKSPLDGLFIGTAASVGFMGMSFMNLVLFRCGVSPLERYELENGSAL